MPTLVVIKTSGVNRGTTIVGCFGNSCWQARYDCKLVWSWNGNNQECWITNFIYYTGQLSLSWDRP